MFTCFHITPEKNVESILATGLRLSDGIDGRGVYAWRRDFPFAMQDADLSLSDSWYKLSDKQLLEKYKHLSVIKIELEQQQPELVVSWEDYIVLRDAVPPSCVSCLGNFYELLSGIIEPHSSSSAK